MIINLLKDVEAVSKKARQDDDLGTEHLQVTGGGVMVLIDAPGVKKFGAHGKNLGPHPPTPAIKTTFGRILESCSHRL